jgi:hypothetical protein
MMSFAMQMRQVSPLAQATTVAMKRAIWARGFNHIANVVASAGGADNCNHLGRVVHGHRSVQWRKARVY